MDHCYCNHIDWISHRGMAPGVIEDRLNKLSETTNNEFCWSKGGKGEVYFANTGDRDVEVDVVVTSFGFTVGKGSRVIPSGQVIQEPIDFLIRGCLKYTARCKPGEGNCSALLKVSHPV